MLVTVGLRFKNLVIKVFGKAFCGLVVVMTIDVCLAAFSITVMQNNSSDILLQIWLSIELLQGFAFLIPCWFASKITEKVN